MSGGEMLTAAERIADAGGYKYGPFVVRDPDADKYAVVVVGCDGIALFQGRAEQSSNGRAKDHVSDFQTITVTSKEPQCERL